MRKELAMEDDEMQTELVMEDEESQEEVVIDDNEDEEEKDETERELERIVFGDSVGFRKGLQGIEPQAREDGASGEGDDITGLEGVDDAHLFFTDTGTAGDLHTSPAEDSNDDDTFTSRKPAVWEDSDEERMMISLASAPRLRKLRRTEAEDVVNGKQYARRLRRQYEQLHSRPQWAVDAMQQPMRKRRKLSSPADSDAENGASECEMDLDDDGDVPNVAPLSKLLQDAASLIRSANTTVGKKRKLRPEVLDIQRIQDIAGTQASAITSLSFHPQLPLLLSSGPSSTLYLHHLTPSPPAPTPNPLLTSLHIRGTALTTTAFHPTSTRIFLSARRRYFHVWDLHTGRVEKIARVYGQQHEQRSMEHFKLSPDGAYMALLGSVRKGGGVLNVLSAATLQWACQVRIESRGGIADFAWWRDGKGLCIAGKSGEVTEWSVAERRVVARWQDEGAVGTTTIALGGKHDLVKSRIGTDRWVAVGSSSGIVNVYDRRVWVAIPSSAKTSESSSPVVPASPKPTRMLDQLTTPTSHLAFSPDGQVLAVASKWKRDALRLVHLPSCTVFKNWPTSATPLGRITGVAFAAGGEGTGGEEVLYALAVANESGKIRVWEIR